MYITETTAEGQTYQYRRRLSGYFMMNRIRRRGSSSPPPPSPFFKLSRELRDIVYGFVFQGTTLGGRPSHRKFLHPYDSFAVEVSQSHTTTTLPCFVTHSNPFLGMDDPSPHKPFDDSLNHYSAKGDVPKYARRLGRRPLSTFHNSAFASAPN